MSRYRDAVLLTVLLASPALAEPLGLGREALPEEIAAWDVDVMPDGTGLPEGSGDVATGEGLFLEKCAACHGDFAEGLDNWPALAGGEDTLDREDPVKTVGSYWPHLSTLWDYVHRSMPFGQAQILTPDETYAITAYILYSNYLVEEDFVLSKENFADITMPNAEGFIVDDRPETEYPLFTTEPCMDNCKESVEITMHASVLDVTPDDAADNEKAGADDEASPSLDPELVAAGEKLFAKCKACHMIGEGAKNRVGPVLNGIVGREAGTQDGYQYSPAMIESGITWDADNLEAFLSDPKGFLPGNKMSFPGVKKPEDIAGIIAYLRAHP
ncbi:c-type cytochrome [Paracoccus alkanivorans]|uniref:MFS transporter n=1 Tax=Paracoccus alkanivorans TaxID=2116655 RepID=A0A3M0LXY4_9RHOB|nr:c-type cytochrome [Paracoccus alkanivorans]RMC30312.1 MFS transporter [Paracoccus alkanivorans]